MSLKKRELIRYADVALNISSSHGLLRIKSIKYIVRTAIKIINHQRVFVLHFYSRRDALKGDFSPEYTVFQTQADYITLARDDNGERKWRTGCLDTYIGYPTIDCAFYSHTDELRAVRFCNNTKDCGMEALMAKQCEIMNARLHRRILKRERNILQRMSVVPAGPRGVKGWMERDLLPHYIYYPFVNKKDPKPGYCTSCKHDVVVPIAIHNQLGKCPRCKKKIIFKSIGKSKRVYDRTTAQIIQKAGENELVVRIFKATKRYEDYKYPKFIFYEAARIFLSWDSNNNVSVTPYYYAAYKGVLTNWKKGFRPSIGGYNYQFDADLTGYLHRKNLSVALDETPFQYCQLEEYYLMDSTPLYAPDYLCKYLQYPSIEYLVKLELERIVTESVYRNSYISSDVINLSGQNPREVLGVEPEELPMLQSLNISVKELGLFLKLKELGNRTDIAFFEWLRNADRVIYLNTNDILNPLKYTTLKKLVRYVKKQFYTLYANEQYDQAKRVLGTYCDYLRFAEELKYNLESDFVLFPKRLQEAHDQASDLIREAKEKAAKLIRAKQRRTANGVIQKTYQALLEQYGFEKFGLTIIPPKSAREIVAEGHELEHCVGNYFSRIVENESIILFVRAIDDIDKPFYTLELRDNQVTQIQGKKHIAPTPEVKKFLGHWEERCLATAA